MRDLRRVLAGAVSAILLALVPTAAVAAPTYPGDVDPTFVGWFDEAGQRVETAAPGRTVVAHFTITNSLAYPIRVNGLDSELTTGPCLRDLQRVTQASDAGGIFPVYLAPGQTSAELADVGYRVAADSTCGTLPTWMGNVISEQGTPPPTPSVSVATAYITETHTQTQTRATDTTPLIAVGVIAAVAVLGGVATLVARSRSRHR